jgi:hypothetical protein
MAEGAKNLLSELRAEAGGWTAGITAKKRRDWIALGKLKSCVIVRVIESEGSIRHYLRLLII